MQHCTKHHRHKHEFYYKGPPPPLSSPRNWFLYADTSRTGFICQQNLIHAISAHLRPTHHNQRNFILNKVIAICKSCNILSYHKINVDGFLHCKVDKRLIQLEEEYEKTFRPIHDKAHNLKEGCKPGNEDGRENFVVPKTA